MQNESPCFGLLRALQATGSSHVGGIDHNNCIDVDGHKVLEGRNIMDVTIVVETLHLCGSASVSFM